MDWDSMHLEQKKAAKLPDRSSAQEARASLHVQPIKHAQIRKRGFPRRGENARATFRTSCNQAKGERIKR